VSNSSRAVAATVVGAVVGGVAGYLFFTDHGRGVRRSLEPMLDDIARELSSFRTTLRRASGVASEGWKLLNEAIGEDTMQGRRFPSTHQSSPF